jgi:hypothetical protein
MYEVSLSVCYVITYTAVLLLVTCDISCPKAVHGTRFEPGTTRIGAAVTQVGTINSVGNRYVGLCAGGFARV